MGDPTDSIRAVAVTRLFLIALLIVTVSAGSAAASAMPPGARSRVVGAAARVDTGWDALDRAIAQIPSYDPNVAHWHVQDRGYWGATNLDTGDIYIAPRAPLDKLVSIVLHEYGHALAGYLYGGRLPAQIAADRYFHQFGERGLEIEADCMARVQGATWTWYTPCTNSFWRAGARRLLAHNLLPL